MSGSLLTWSDRWRLGVIALCALVFALAAPFTAVEVEWASFAPVYFMAALLAAIGLTYRVFDRDQGIAATTLVAAQIALYSNLAVLDNYLGFELRRPLNDAFLAQVDRAIGLDWLGYVNWVKSSSVLGGVLTLAYQSSLLQVAVAIMALGFTRRFERLDKFTLAFMFSASLTIAVWIAFPSYGALPLHYSQGLPEPPFELTMTKDEALKLLALHAGPTPTLRLGEVTGLIGCPSFHTVLAVLTVFAFWGIRAAGPLSIAVNFFVLLSIPADGGHHFIDVAVGGGVALASLYLADLVLDRAPVESLDVAEARGVMRPMLRL